MAVKLGVVGERKFTGAAEDEGSEVLVPICSHTGRGRLADRIFGNGILPEDCPDQHTELPGWLTHSRFSITP